MKKKLWFHILFTISFNFCLLNSLVIITHAANTIYLNNVNNDFTIDGYTNVWYNTSTDQRDISVRFDSSTSRIITGVRLHYRTARLLAPYGDCPTTYKFESGANWVDYDDVLPNTTGVNQIHEFHCQGDTFLIANSFFYISMGVGSDDPYIQVGVDTDRSGHSEYSLNGGSWTSDTVEYLVEALVENINVVSENENKSGLITATDDFVDALNISLNKDDDAHFNLISDNSGEYFNMRFFNTSAKLSSDGNAIWLEEGSISQKTHHYISPNSQNFLILIEPNTDGVDNGSYTFNWTYNPDPPSVNALPASDTDGNVTLTWVTPIDSDIEYYNIYRSGSPNVPLDGAHRITTPGTLNTTNYKDNYLLNGTYYYTITSVDKTGHESRASNEVVTTVGDIVKPNAPILNTPESYPIDNDGTILINWTFQNLDDVISCNIYRSRYSEFQVNSSNFLTNILKTSLSFEDQLVLSGFYYYMVTSIDLNGLESIPSNKVNTTYIDITPPAIPQNVKFEITQNREVTLSWDDNNDFDFSYYKVYRSNQKITDENINKLSPVVTTTKSSWKDTDLSAGKKYYYVIIAVDLNGLESKISKNIEIEISEETNSIDVGTLFYILLILIILALVSCTLFIIYRKGSRTLLSTDKSIKTKFLYFKDRISLKLDNFKESLQAKVRKLKSGFKTPKSYKSIVEIDTEEEFEMELTEDELDLLKSSQLSEKVKDDDLKRLWEESGKKE
ncbi:MAG: fibronectin type III domain-containing protein [Promethearchaeota archaeon]